MIRKHVIVRGRVQGVGFRYITSSIASKYHVTGWVRNEWDGTVTMEVQGRETLINKLLVGLNNDRFISIDWIDSEEIPLRQDEKKFSVK